MARQNRDFVDIKVFEVIDTDGTRHTIKAHFVFDNTAEGAGSLVFRRKNETGDTSRTHIVCQFAQGFWKHFKEIA